MRSCLKLIKVIRKQKYCILCKYFSKSVHWVQFYLRKTQKLCIFVQVFHLF